MKMKKNKIVFLVLHLGCGGAERAVISEANLLSAHYPVEILSAYQLAEEPAFSVDSNVQVTYLRKNLRPNKEELRQSIASKNPIRIAKELFRSLRVLYLRTHLMKKAVRNSDGHIFISSRYLYHRLLTKNAPKGAVCIAQEHNHHNNDDAYIRRQVKAVAKMDYFMPVSEELTEFYKKRVASSVSCLYIPHHLELIPEQVSPLTGKGLISVGRFSPEKGMDELIRVYQEVAKLHPDWELHLVGDGELRPALEQQAAETGLEGKIHFHGFCTQEQIRNLMKEMSVYVMTSHTEAFGLVLIEAQAMGLPCVAYDSAQGAREILRSGENGVLIPSRDRGKMTEQICRWIEDAAERRSIGDRGRASVLIYKKENVEKKWVDLIQSCGGER